jgi:thioredoxin reductase (NADPH)
MDKPIVLAVDDEPHVLHAVERDLRQHYGRDYRIMAAGSGEEALEAVQLLKRRNAPIALFVADQRMPGLSGTEFLARASKLYPDARKVLLTAYADTEAAIASINDIGLDYYFLKPWDPPEQTLYPVLDDLLSDWRARVSLPYEGIRVAGTLWSPSSHQVKDFLARNGIPYQWLDVERDEEARELVETVDRPGNQLPVVFFPDGEVLVNPDHTILAQQCGLQTQASHPFYDLIIVGAGPAGLGAAVYGASEGLRTALIEREATGGQAGTSSRIENYLGFPKGLSGADLARRATAQAQRLGTEILTAQEVVKVRVEDSYRLALLRDGTELRCRALVVATGVSVRKLKVPGVEALTGAGAYYGAALTEAAHYRGEHVFVVGGGNSAGQAAVYFAGYADEVSLLIRDDALSTKMSQYLVDQIYAIENIEVLLESEVTQVRGEQHLEALTVRDNRTGELKTVPAAALFIFIGAVPRTDLVDGIIERSERGFIYTGQDLVRGGRRPKGWRLKRDPYLLETSVPGIFAAGDVRYGAVRRVATAVGEGAMAISYVHQYLKTV